MRSFSFHFISGLWVSILFSLQSPNCFAGGNLSDYARATFGRGLPGLRSATEKFLELYPRSVLPVYRSMSRKVEWLWEYSDHRQPALVEKKFYFSGRPGHLRLIPGFGDFTTPLANPNLAKTTYSLQVSSELILVHSDDPFHPKTGILGAEGVIRSYLLDLKNDQTLNELTNGSGYSMKVLKETELTEENLAKLRQYQNDILTFQKKKLTKGLKTALRNYQVGFTEFDESEFRNSQIKGVWEITPSSIRKKKFLVWAEPAWGATLNSENQLPSDVLLKFSKFYLISGDLGRGKETLANIELQQIDTKSIKQTGKNIDITLSFDLDNIRGEDRSNHLFQVYLGTNNAVVSAILKERTTVAKSLIEISRESSAFQVILEKLDYRVNDGLSTDSLTDYLFEYLRRIMGDYKGFALHPDPGREPFFLAWYRANELAEIKANFNECDKILNVVPLDANTVDAVNF